MEKRSSKLRVAFATLSGLILFDGYEIVVLLARGPGPLQANDLTFHMALALISLILLWSGFPAGYFGALAVGIISLFLGGVGLIDWLTGAPSVLGLGEAAVVAFSFVLIVYTVAAWRERRRKLHP